MLYAFLGAICIASLSITGAIVFGTRHLSGTHRFIVPAAIGVFLGVVFFELIPETLEASHEFGTIAIVVGFLSFYLLSHVLRTYHHHHRDSGDGCEHRIGATKLLIGDGVHNIADGVVIASAFLINPVAGVAVTIGVALHEIPQEIAEYGVLIAAGYSRKKAMLFNFLSASSIFIGVLLSMLFISLGDYVWILTGVAAGNLLYIAASDMIPELNTESHHGHFVQTFASTLIGLIAITLLLHLNH